MAKVLQVFRGVGPYLLVALLVPGGLLIAPLAWLFRRRFKRAVSPEASSSL